MFQVFAKLRRNWAPLSVLGLMMVPQISWADEVDDPVAKALEAGDLRGRYNPAVLDYLLEEGASRLDESTRRRAIEQLVASLKKDIKITPEEQRTASLATAASLIAGAAGGDAGRAAYGASFEIWSAWVDSAEVLNRAGYREEAEAFFAQCMQIYPVEALRSRCAIALAQSRPQEAVSRLQSLLEGHDQSAVKVALRLLGQLAESGRIEAAQTQAIFEAQAAHLRGLKKATFGEAAIQGLAAGQDPRAIPLLKPLAKGMMNKQMHDDARRALLIDFGDRSVVPLLEKTATSKGALSTVEPWERLAAGTLLLEAGDDAGYAWAESIVAADQPSKGKAFAKRFLSKKRDQVDQRPAVITVLVRYGDVRAIEVLKRATTESGSWLEAWTALALLELGDTSRIDVVKRSLARDDWQFTVVRASQALGRHEDYSGISALEALYRRALEGKRPDAGKNLGWLRKGSSANRGVEEAELRQLKHQIAEALAGLDRPEAVPVLDLMLEDPEPSVRAGAAYALSRMSQLDAMKILRRALDVSFDDGSSNPKNAAVKATLLRRAAAQFPDRPELRDLLEHGAQLSEPSARFVALVASRPVH